jgi:hypothetical protein
VSRPAPAHRDRRLVRLRSRGRRSADEAVRHGARRCPATATQVAMMPPFRTAAVSETTTDSSDTTTGSWKPTWSPGHTRSGLPPLTVVHDPHDDHAFMAAALAAHTPPAGRITVHPHPGGKRTCIPGPRPAAQPGQAPPAGRQRGRHVLDGCPESEAASRTAERTSLSVTVVYRERLTAPRQARPLYTSSNTLLERSSARA